MKNLKKIAFIVLIATVLVGSVACFNSNNSVADMKEDKKIVSVSGIGIISAEPDMAYINIGVETEKPTVSEAQKVNKQKMDAVMKAIKSVGIKENNIQTVRYDVYDRYHYNNDKSRTKYYQVTNNVEVKIEDTKKLSEVIDVVSKAGSNQISNIRFDVSNRKELYQKALKLAMKDANEKATSIMSAFGQKPGEPYRVMEGNYGIHDYNMRMENMKMMDAGGNVDTSISTGELRVSARLSVEYDY